MKKIEEMHQEVFDLLMKYHKADPDFVFTFRKINRKGRLDKGYWFLGDEKYLTVSFWMGRDWMAKKPNISFTILADGKAFLDLTAKSISSKFNFFEKSLLDALGVVERGYNQGYHKAYSNYADEEYLKALEEFIKVDKPIIDEAVANRTGLNPLALEYEDELEFIFHADFAKCLKRIYKYQEKIKKRIRETGYIRKVVIDKYGPISHLEIDDITEGCKWIFITGENGAGKSTVLKAIATGLTRNNDDGVKVTEVNSDFAIQITLDAHNGLRKHSIKKKDENHETTKWLRDGLAFFGPIRLFTEANAEKLFFGNHIEQVKASKATYGLFNSVGILRDMTKGISLMERPKYHEGAVYDLIEHLEEILPGMNLISPEWNNKGGLVLKYYIDNPEGELPAEGVDFEDLPSGTKNFAAIILDLLIRFREFDREISDPSEYAGIVLIDEIDLHLHPKMQIDLIYQIPFPKSSL